MYSNILVPVAFEDGAQHEASLNIARKLASDGAMRCWSTGIRAGRSASGPRRMVWT